MEKKLKAMFVNEPAPDTVNDCPKTAVGLIFTLPVPEVNSAKTAARAGANANMARSAKAPVTRRRLNILIMGNLEAAP